MSRLAQADAIHVPSAAITPRLSLWARVRCHLASLNAAHARQLRHMHLGGEVSGDVGLPPEVVLGESTYDPALPFFLQSGFDRR